MKRTQNIEKNSVGRKLTLLTDLPYLIAYCRTTVIKTMCVHVQPDQWSTTKSRNGSHIFAQQIFDRDLLWNISEVRREGEVSRKGKTVKAQGLVISHGRLMQVKTEEVVLGTWVMWIRVVEEQLLVIWCLGPDQRSL